MLNLTLSSAGPIVPLVERRPDRAKLGGWKGGVKPKLHDLVLPLGKKDISNTRSAKGSMTLAFYK